MLSVLNAKAGTSGIFMVQRAFNKDGMVHKGFAIPMSSHSEVPHWYCEWNYRDASRLCTHGLLSILSW